MSGVNFFGHIIVPKNAYKHTPPESTMLHISQAALAADCSEGRNTLQVTVDDKTFTLCTLEKGKCENAFLNLNFGAGQEISMQMLGESPVHITGYYEVLPDEDEDDDFADQDDSEYARAYRRALAGGYDEGDDEDEEIFSDEADDEDESFEMDDEDEEMDGEHLNMLMDEEDFSDDEDDADFRPISTVKVEDVTDKKRKASKALPPPAKKAKKEHPQAKKEQQQQQPKKKEESKQQQQPAAKKEQPTPAKKEQPTPAKKEQPTPAKKEQQPKKKEEAKTPEQGTPGTPGSGGKKKKNKKNKKKQQQQQ